ncbi:flagellar biosynthesis protein FlhA (plasmid) [Aristophania vespae]|uniref:Flagellar biosynthesis protein FlhA n=1 Tax=Aristophania vespae TaxID=2697033 RepID=A0A6P1NGH1_9PROT|nr:flagellar biosynthesis protein FlhA [Aristophania vespae]QHI96518.1 flagellar biosynthesis protein FlhA [Aristophania vespae]
MGGFNLQSKLPGTDILLAVGVILLISILVIPLPTFILDIGLSLSITSSVLILMVALFLESPLDFTSFPTLLLLTTMFRLSLEVATTRLILSHGNEGSYAAGHVVASFGGFLMGNDIVIGGIVFCILLVVNFMVITKGSGRIAEVSARFFLDAMPGKQMAIDADLASGAINERTARRKRKGLEEESSFYGSMDGAAKFVRNDAIAGIIITAINIIGGLTIGVLRHHMPVSEAAQTFTTLTIGDGLVSQIPALLVSLAAGIVVTKGGTDGSADVTLFRQLGSNPKPLAIAASLSAVFAFMPGLPAFPFLLIAAIAGIGAWLRHKTPLAVDNDGDEITQTVSQPTTKPVADLLRLDLIRLEIGFGLLSLASEDDTHITGQIKALRRKMAAEMGFITPSVRIQDNISLGTNQYVIKLKEIEIASSEVRPNLLLAICPEGFDKNNAIPGEMTTEPSFNLPAVWINQDLKTKATNLGYTVVDPVTVIITHLTESISQNLGELLTYAATQELLDDLPSEHQKLVNDLIPSQVSLSTVQRVLQSLLQERISIRDLPTILESIQEGSALIPKGIKAVTAHVRIRLSRQISNSYVGPSGCISMITLSPEWETNILNNTVGQGDEKTVAMPPQMLDNFVTSMRKAFDRTANLGELPVIVTTSSTRDCVRMIVDRVRPSVAVMSQAEIYPRTRIRTVATIT